MPYDDDVVKIGAELVFTPYNPVNKQIGRAEVEALLKRYGLCHEITNLELYQQAFVHTSYCVRPIKTEPRPADCLELQPKSNERLEFLGDGVLECITKQYLFTRFPKENEGFMTEKKIGLVKNDAIGKFADDIGLKEWFVISRNNEAKQVRHNLKKLGCLFEAFLGAIFIDFNSVAIADDDGWFDSFISGPGYQACQRFLVSIFEHHVNWAELLLNDYNFKNILQVRLQREFKHTPEYVELSHSSSGYKMGVFLCIGQPMHAAPLAEATPISDANASFKYIHDYVKRHKKGLFFLASGIDKIKKKSEQLACENALMKFGILK